VKKAERIRVAVGQMAPKMGDVRGNFAKLMNMTRAAVDSKADIVVFPELATAGYLSQAIFYDVAEKSSQYLQELAEEAKGISVVLGLVEEDRSGTLYNSAMVLRDGQAASGIWKGKQVKSYRKLYLPTYGMFEESRWFAPGSGVPVYDLDTEHGSFRAGIIICEDYWQPLPARIAAARGADIILAIAGSPKSFGKPAMTHALLTARAIENSTYVAFSNQAGSQDMVNFWGGSEVIDYKGVVVASAPLREENLLIAEVDLYKQRKYREINPIVREEREEVIRDYDEAFKEMREAYPA